MLTQTEIFQLLGTQDNSLGTPLYRHLRPYSGDIVSSSDGCGRRRFPVDSVWPLTSVSSNFRYDEIKQVEVGKSNLIDGWGIHMSLRGGWGWDCVIFRFKNGKTLRIGTDDANNLVTFLEGKLNTRESK